MELIFAVRESQSDANLPEKATWILLGKINQNPRMTASSAQQILCGFQTKSVGRRLRFEFPATTLGVNDENIQFHFIGEVRENNRVGNSRIEVRCNIIPRRNKLVDESDERFLAGNKLMVVGNFAGQFAIRRNHERWREDGHDQFGNGAEFSCCAERE